ncbi:hypothetical protein ND925_21360 [Vibrio diabolicus]|uniref:hypothetical protein n=1 Tax=Vibrio diabolicus TaxID=50719 RepID=UPI00215E510D|nr:hypothetical protein [Vibrio diabolicus]MCS0368555.1 hypothetical protein [Vibrio diabolicus]MCS0378609.1 hypothetical protein [Vibrio diabolicus]MCS0385310.1 hypothetical protein [Vibrio diabolicus]MCS0424264.1 hypothetical protein [Vibrio diabolicus]
MRDIQIKAGDIILMSSKTTNSFGIRLFTATSYSHVGYAVNSDVIIDSVPNKHKGPSIRVLHKSQIINDSKRVRIYKREPELTQNELHLIEHEVFKLICEDSKSSAYHKGLAAFSSISPIIKFYSILGSVVLAILAVTFFDSNVELLSLASFIFLIGSYGMRHGRKLTIKLSRKYPSSRYFSDIPGTFCSHLVRLIERRINSPLAKIIEPELLPRPKEIMSACRKAKMEWVEYKF